MRPMIEEYERANAREWDESPKKPTPIIATAKKSSATPTPNLIPTPPRPAGEDALRVFRNPQQTSLGLQNAAGQVSSSRVHLGQQSSQYSAEKREDGSREKSNLSKKWAKQDLTTTQRQTDSTKKEKRATEENQFLKQAPNYDFVAKSYHFWPDKETPLGKLLGGENLSRLHDIRKQCRVFIEFDVASHCLRIISKSWESNDDALGQIKLAIQSARAELKGYTSLVVVEPPSGSAIQNMVTPQFKDVQDSSQQPVIKKVNLSGSKLTVEEALIWQTKREELINENRARLSEHLRTTFRKLGDLQSGMRMRVHLGHMELYQYHKKFGQTAYSMQRFMDMVSQPRTTAQLEKNIGDGHFASKIKSHIAQAPEMFSPADSVTSTVAEIMTKHSLIVLAQTPSKEHVRIEADFDEVSKKNEWQIGTTTCFRFTGRKTCLKVGMLGFESFFDWSLEIVTNDIVPDTPEKLKLTRSFRNPVMRNDKFGLSYPSIQPQLHPDIRIHQTCIRSMEQYRLTGTPYILEAAVYRKWDGKDTTTDPSTEYGLTLYNKDWDVSMSPEENTRNWGPELGDFFPGLDFEDGFSDFLSHVQKLRQFLNHGVETFRR